MLSSADGILDLDSVLNRCLSNPNVRNFLFNRSPEPKLTTVAFSTAVTHDITLTTESSTSIPNINVTHQNHASPTPPLSDTDQIAPSPSRTFPTRPQSPQHQQKKPRHSKPSQRRQSCHSGDPVNYRLSHVLCRVVDGFALGEILANHPDHILVRLSINPLFRDIHFRTIARRFAMNLSRPGVIETVEFSWLEKGSLVIHRTVTFLNPPAGGAVSHSDDLLFNPETVSSVLPQQWQCFARISRAEYCQSTCTTCLLANSLDCTCANGMQHPAAVAPAAPISLQQHAIGSWHNYITMFKKARKAAVWRVAVNVMVQEEPLELYSWVVNLQINVSNVFDSIPSASAEMGVYVAITGDVRRTLRSYSRLPILGGEAKQAQSLESYDSNVQPDTAGSNNANDTRATARTDRKGQVSNSEHLRCGVCGSQFRLASRLDIHIQTVHLRQRPFVCSYDGCGQRFARKSTMSRHLRGVHQAQRYSCEQCPASYTQSFDLKVRPVTQSSSPPYITNSFTCIQTGISS